MKNLLTPHLTHIGLALIIVAPALDHYYFDAFSINIRPEHVAFLLVGFFWLVRLVRRRETPKFVRDDLLLAVYLGIALFVSVLNAPALKDSLSFVGLMAFAVALYWLVRELVRDAGSFRAAVTLLCGVGVIEAVLALASWIGYPLGLAPQLHSYIFELGAAFNEGCNYTFAPSATLFESNILGSYLAAVSLIFIVLLLSNEFPSRRLSIGFCLLLTLAGLGLSLSRGAWLGFAFGLIFVLLVTPSARLAVQAACGVAAIALVASVAALSIQLSPLLIRLPSAPLASKVAACDRALASSTNVKNVGPAAPPSPSPQTVRPTTPSSTSTKTVRPTARPTPSPKPVPQASPTPSLALQLLHAPPLPPGAPPILQRALLSKTVADRWIEDTAALQEWGQHPWFGTGANSFAQTHLLSRDVVELNWISNVELMALHDTGVIGFFVLAAWCAWLAWEARGALKNSKSNQTRLFLLAICAAVICLLVAFQFTNALWLGFSWIYLGLVRAGTLILGRAKSGPAREAKPYGPDK